MRAITLWQPWAWSMGTSLIKGVENRTWPPPRWLLGRRIALHAGKKFCKASADSLDSRLLPSDPELPPKSQLVFGAVIAVTTVAAVVTSIDDVPTDQRRFFFGPYGWLVTNTRRLDEPVYCRGWQGLWRLPESVERRVLEQVEPYRWEGPGEDHEFYGTPTNLKE